MASITDLSNPTPPSEEPGLPPVNPPSGRFIVQLFVVPGLIVVCLVGLLLAVNYLISGSRTPEYFLEKLDDPNPEVRWRAASDLSQVLPRDNELAGDPWFGLELTLRLERAYTNSQEAEEQFAKKVGSLTPDEAQQQRLPLEPDRDRITMMIGCVKHFIVPIGVSMLKKVATDERGMEVVPRTKHRRQALIALAMIGNNMERFDALTVPEKEAIVAELGELSKRKDISSWAMEAREYLRNRMANKQSTMGLAEIFQQLAEEEDPKLRYLSAFASRFWYGTDAENAALDAMLVRLSNDDGRGEGNIEKFEGTPSEEEAKQPKEVWNRPGFFVQMNAVVSLASRGSDQVPLEKLGELLDPKFLSETIRVHDPNGKVSANTGKVEMIVYSTLQTVRKLKRKNPELDLSSLRPLVANLTDYKNPAIAQEAKETLSTY